MAPLFCVKPLTTQQYLRTQMSSHWNLYWQNNFTGSFGDQEPLWYGQKIKPIWINEFSHFPAQCKMLDVATGNGAVTRLALDHLKDTDMQWEIEAVDSAITIAPAGVKLLPSCPLEKLEIEQKDYHFISSQFGLEYSSINLSLPRLSSGLKTGGLLTIIAHHRESILCDNSRNEIEQYRACFQKDSIISRLQKLITKMGEVRTPADLQLIQDKASKARQSLNHTVSRLTAQFPQGIVIAELLKNIEPLFNKKENLYSSLAVKLEYIKHVEKQMRLAHNRLTDQVSAALMDKDIKQWEKIASKHKLKLSRQDLIATDAHEILAWHLQFTKE